jgi:protein tyrosine/serine phosphatase
MLRNVIWCTPILVMLSGVAAAQETAPPAGIVNFHRVNESLFRGAQPTDEGFRSLAKLGIKTVIDLRETGDRSLAEKKTVELLGMRYLHIPFPRLSAPSDAQVAQVLRIMGDQTAGPVFVHCRRGADRTGTVLACYRISHDHWENAKALEEARTLGMSWIERGMQQYVLGFKVATTAPTVLATVSAAAN